LSLQDELSQYETPPIDSNVKIVSLEPLDYTITTSSPGTIYNYKTIVGQIVDSWNVLEQRDLQVDILYKELMNPDILSGDSFSGLFISCTTLKDPVSFDGRYHTIEAITYISYEAFNKFKDEGSKRSKEYLEFKELLTEKMISTLEKVLPEVREKIVHKELGTPMTNEFFINATNGCVYGTEKSFRQTGPFSYKAKSEIENLYLCGASVLSHGVAGASYSGVQTAAIILNCKQKDLLKPDDSQNIRVYDAEDATDYPDWMLKKMKVKRDRLIAKK